MLNRVTNHCWNDSSRNPYCRPNGLRMKNCPYCCATTVRRKNCQSTGSIGGSKMMNCYYPTTNCWMFVRLRKLFCCWMECGNCLMMF